MSFNSFLRRASSSMTLLWTFRSITSVRPYQRSLSVLDPLNSGRQFPTFVRFFTAPVEKAPPEEEPAGETVTESTLDPLDSLPFKIKDGSPAKGYLTLIREDQDAVIEVKVRPCKKKRVKEEDVWKLLEADEAMEVDTWKYDDQEIRNLYMLVTINYRDGYNKCEKFFVFAISNLIFIRTMSSRVKDGTKSLEEFEEIFHQKVMGPTFASNIFSIASMVSESGKKTKLTSSTI